MMASKDLMPIFKSVADLKPTEDATIHGIIANVSPMKKGNTPYFDARLCDGEKQVRVVGFTSGQRKRLSNCEDTMDFVDLQKVRVKKAKHSEELEVVLKSSSEVRVQSSPNKAELLKVQKVLSNTITLSQLETQKEYDRVTVTGKVIRIEDPIKVSPNLRKQNVTIADSTAAAKITLWEDSIGKLSVNKSYRFSRFTVRIFRSDKYLSLPRDGAMFEEVPDIGEVAEDDLPDDTVVIKHAKVAAATVTRYCSCVACNSKLEPIDNILSRCTKCDMQQLTDNNAQQTSANLLISSGAEYIQLSAFKEVLCNIIGGADITVPNLLTAPRFRCTYENKLITSVVREED